MLPIGARFGRLMVIGDGGRAASGNLRSRCRCDCGKEVCPTDTGLRTGNTRSCGCLKREQNSASARAKFTRHGHARPGSVSPTWTSWNAMRERCTRREHHAWGRYGGRGITVCDRWLHSFENFLADMGERPVGTSLDRIDPNWNYEPGNCRWAGRAVQGRNRRNVNRLRVGDQELTIAEWAERIGIARDTLAARVASGWSPEDVVGRPLRPTRKPGPRVNDGRIEVRG